MLAVGRVGHCIEEFAVAPRAAHIIRWTRIRSVSADGVFQSNRGPGQLFDEISCVQESPKSYSKVNRWTSRNA